MKYCIAANIIQQYSTTCHEKVSTKYCRGGRSTGCELQSNIYSMSHLKSMYVYVCICSNNWTATYQALTRQVCFCLLFYILLIVLIILHKKVDITFIIKNLNDMFFFNSQIKYCCGLRKSRIPDVLSPVKPSLAPKTGLMTYCLGPLRLHRGLFSELPYLPPFLLDLNV